MLDVVLIPSLCTSSLLSLPVWTVPRNFAFFPVLPEVCYCDIMLRLISSRWYTSDTRKTIFSILARCSLRSASTFSAKSARAAKRNVQKIPFEYLYSKQLN